MKRLLALAVLGSFVAGSTAHASPIGFAGDYAPANWTLTLTNSDGTVNTAGAPNSIFITSGDNGSFLQGFTDYTVTAAATGLVSFDWSYTTVDPPSVFDPFGYLLNGVFTQLTNNALTNQAGVASFLVNQGDTFGFRARTADNIFGRSTTTISNFNAPTPEPATLAVFGLMAAGAFGVRRRLKVTA